MAADQRADDLEPTKVTDRFWLHAERKRGKYPAHTERGGKWLIFVSSARVDEAWAKVKRATEDGLLGGSAKVATAKPNPHAKNPNNHVICVYTYDSSDEADAWRIREKLRELGFTTRIPYKLDADTAVKYANEGHKRISKFLG